MKTRIVLTLTLAAALGRVRRRPLRLDGARWSRPSIRSRSPRSRSAATRVDVRNLTPPGVEPHDLELSRQRRRSDRATPTSSSTSASGFQPALEDAIDAHVGARRSISSTPRPARGGEDGARHRSPRLARPGPVRRDRRTHRRGARSPRGGGAVRRASCERSIASSARPRRLRAATRSSRATRRSATWPSATASSRSRSRASRRRRSRRRATSSGVVEQVRAIGATTVFFETLVSPRLAETVAREVGRDRPPCSTRSKA